MIMNYFNVILNDICKGLAKPNDIKHFLDEVLDLICEDGFTELVSSLFNTIRQFKDKIFRYDETCNHVIKELIQD